MIEDRRKDSSLKNRFRKSLFERFSLCRYFFYFLLVSIYERHQFFELGNDAALLGERGEWEWQIEE